MIIDYLLIALFVAILAILSLNPLKSTELKTQISWLLGALVTGATAIVGTISLPGLINDEAHNSLVGLWFEISNVSINIDYYLDGWSVAIALISSWLTFFIVVYSWTYIGKTSRAPLYYSLVVLFLFGMLMLLLSNNLIVIFFGWEIVGICSWALISFYYYKGDVGQLASLSGLKALVTTGLADLGLLAAMFMLVRDGLGLEISTLIAGGIPQYVVVGLLVAAAGKSAQFPLHIWISSTDRTDIDAMQGPTTVSALIHAATMVNAGVYLVSRAVTFHSGEGYLEMVMYLGSITALYAAICAMGTYDFKRVLAYSTISQLGYMVTALGVHGMGSFMALWHLINHAFFKALLFLTVGVIIHSLHIRDIRDIKVDLKKKWVISIPLLVGFLSLTGFPGASGFFSKDLIIEELLHEEHMVPAVLLIVAAFFTAAYSLRFLRYVLMPENAEEGKDVHVSTSNAAVLIILSIATLLSTLSFNLLGSWLEKSPEHLIEGTTWLITLAVVLVGYVFGWSSSVFSKRMPKFIMDALFAGFYIDDLLVKTSTVFKDFFSKVAVMIQTGEHYWNMFFFTVAATAISGLLYFYQSGGFF